MTIQEAGLGSGKATRHNKSRIIHDADSHIIETPGFLEEFASDYVKENLMPGLVPLDLPALKPVLKKAEARLAGNDPETTQALKENLFGHPDKLMQWTSFGGSDSKERSESLDIAGIKSQLVFPSLASSRFSRTEDMKLAYGGAEALIRAMSAFCSVDPRLDPVCHLPLYDVTKTLECARFAVSQGIKAFWIHSDEIDGRAPSHAIYDPLWSLMEEVGIPIVLHIGSGIKMPEAYFNTGSKRNLEPTLTNIETTRPKDLPVLHHSIERWLTCMIYDGVLERFPNLKIGLIELGANWIPAALENLDLGVSALGRFDNDLKALSMKPSDYVRRQVRVTPFHMENTGWILRNSGKEILMFNTDYPHPEGGSDPFGDFERSLNAVGATDEELDAFYSKNYEYLMGR